MIADTNNYPREIYPETMTTTAPTVTTLIIGFLIIVPMSLDMHLLHDVSMISNIYK